MKLIAQVLLKSMGQDLALAQLAYEHSILAFLARRKHAGER